MVLKHAAFLFLHLLDGNIHSKSGSKVSYLLRSSYCQYTPFMIGLKGLDNSSQGLLMTGLLVMLPADVLDDPLCAHDRTVPVFCVEFFQ
jgi:hypothetical protein